MLTIVGFWKRLWSVGGKICRCRTIMCRYIFVLITYLHNGKRRTAYIDCNIIRSKPQGCRALSVPHAVHMYKGDVGRGCYMLDAVKGRLVGSNSEGILKLVDGHWDLHRSPSSIFNNRPKEEPPSVWGVRSSLASPWGARPSPTPPLASSLLISSLFLDSSHLS